jgi:hypothetical protein
MKFKHLTEALEHYRAELGTSIGLIKDIAEQNMVTRMLTTLITHILNMNSTSLKQNMEI